jgi:hypothetical protein
MGALLTFFLGFLAGGLVGALTMVFLVMARRSGQREPKPSPSRGFSPMDAPSKS